MIDRFENLEVFKESHRFVLLIYNATIKFPSDEKFALTSQLRRAVTSIVANIVEGNARGHSRESEISYPVGERPRLYYQI